jgi:hypothetical protein
VRALLGEGERADSLFRHSIAHPPSARARLELARAHLLYGEWLRESVAASTRSQLRTALEQFNIMGVEAFAERELLAAGEHARKRTVDTLDELTPRRRRSPTLLRTVARIERSPPSYSSARAPSSTTPERRSGNST